MAVKSMNQGQWTPARFRSFIISALRGASQRWGPRNECLKQARTRRGFYKCAGCNKEVPATTKVKLKNGKMAKKKNILADHINPIVDPLVGFVDWNTWIERCFVEIDGYQALCYTCHQVKSQEEKELSKMRRKK